MEHFTPWSALAGGLLIGLSATMLLLWNGRIAGVSGILGGALGPSADGRAWRVAFLAGLVLGCLAVRIASGDSIPVDVRATTPVLVFAGLLVGIGTRVGGGCTSGHAVCGIGRFSTRSIVATMTFMAAGGLTVFFVRHVLGG